MSVSDTVVWYYQPYLVYSMKQIYIKCLLGQGPSGDKETKREVIKEQETDKDKSSQLLSATEASVEEETLGQEPGRQPHGTDPGRDCQLQDRRCCSSAKAQPCQKHRGEQNGWDVKAQHWENYVCFLLKKMWNKYSKIYRFCYSWWWYMVKLFCFSVGLKLSLRKQL